MKILIASDIHGNLENTKELINKFYKYQADRMIILGDIYQGYSIEESMEIANLFSQIRTKLYLLRGNCDFATFDTFSPVGMFEEYNMKIGTKTIYFNHGHKGMPKVEFNENDIYCHGHTHINDITLYHNIIICNPGSVSLPRGGTKASFMIIDETGIYIYDFNDEVIKKYNFEV